MDRNHRERLMRILFGIFLIASLGALSACGGGGGGGGGGSVAPGAFALSAPTGTGIVPTPTLSWSGASGASLYTVQVTTSPTFSFITTYESTTVSTTSVVLSGLTPSTTYYWKVVAQNSVGNTASTPTSAQFTTMKSGEVAWTRTSDPSPIDDQSYAMVLSGGYLYIAGYDSTHPFPPAAGDNEWRIEKWNANDGSVVASFGTASGALVSNPSITNIDYWDDAYGIAVDSTHMYVVGYDSTQGWDDQSWRIEKRDLATGALAASFGAGGFISTNFRIGAGLDDNAYAVAVDSRPTGTMLYVVGFESIDLQGAAWRIEARNKEIGAIISSDTSNFGGGDDIANAIAIDPTEGYMYVVGSDSSSGSDLGWRIEKRMLSAVTTLETASFGTTGFIYSNPSTSGPDEPLAIALDTTHLYVAGYDMATTKVRWRIEKHDRISGALDGGFGSGGIVFSDTTTNALPNAIALDIDKGYMYVAGYDNLSGDLEWRVEKRSLATGALDTTFGANGAYTNPFDTTALLWDSIRAIAVDENYLYIAGYESMPDFVLPGPVAYSSSRWRVEKLVK